jgi:hypothetical protein
MHQGRQLGRADKLRIKSSGRWCHLRVASGTTNYLLDVPPALFH